MVTCILVISISMYFRIIRSMMSITKLNKLHDIASPCFAPHVGCILSDFQPHAETLLFLLRRPTPLLNYLHRQALLVHDLFESFQGIQIVGQVHRGKKHVLMHLHLASSSWRRCLSLQPAVSLKALRLSSELTIFLPIFQDLVECSREYWWNNIVLKIPRVSSAVFHWPWNDSSTQVKDLAAFDMWKRLNFLSGMTIGTAFKSLLVKPSELGADLLAG